MAIDDPYDPYASASVAPWSWVPKEWETHAIGAAPAPDVIEPMQPGLGIPQSMFDAAAQAPPEEIEMPPMDMRPVIGFPHAPDPAPAPENGDVDAISGVGGPPQDPPQDPQEIEMPPMDLRADAGAREFAASSPEARAKQEYDWLQGRQARFDELDRAARLEDERKALENESAAQKARIASRSAMVQIDEESRTAGAEQVDGDRWWNSRSTGQKIAGYISAIVGGLAQGRTGGPNQGLAMIEAAIDRDVDVQKFNMQAKRAELQRRGASIQQLAAFDEETFTNAERFRLASLARVQGQIKSDMQNYDPAGKTAIELGKTYAGIEASYQQGLIAFEDQHFRNQVAARKAEDEHAESVAKTNKMLAEAAKLRGALGGSGGAKAPKDGPGQPDEVMTPDMVLAEMPPGTDPAVLPRGNILRKQLGGHFSTAKSAAEAGKALGESMADAVPDMLLADGSPYRARSKEDADEITDDKATVDTAIDIVDRVLRYRAEHGWSSDFWGSPEGKKAKVDWKQLTLIKKNVDKLGALSEGDVALELGSMGSEDPTGRRDPTPGIRQFRANLVDGFNTKANAKRRPGTAKIARWEPPDMYKGKGKSTPEQENFKKLKNSDTGAVNDPLPSASWVIPGVKLIAKGVNALRSEDTNLPEGSERDQIDAWAKDIRSTDKAAQKRAIGFLANLADSASPAVRAYAHQKFYEAMSKLGKVD